MDESGNPLGEDQIEIAEAALKKRRTEIRRWITNALKNLSMRTRPDSNLNPPISFESVTELSRELISIDEALPTDDKSDEYVQKVAAIVKILEEDNVAKIRYQVEQEKLEAEKMRILVEKKRFEVELRKLEAEDEKLKVEKDHEVEIRQLQIEVEKAKIEKEKVQATAQVAKKTTNSIKLDVQIPQFDGSPCRYRKFEELFEALVENNPSYDEASKYLYFIKLIGKYADTYAPNLSPTLANLGIVKERLRKHFENPSRVREHVRKTFERLPVVRQLSHTTVLHELIVAFEEGVLALRKSKTSEEQINNTYVRLMTSHLPTALLDKCKFEPEWTADMLIKELKVFYERQIALSEFSVDITPIREVKTRSHFHVINPESPFRQSPNRQSPNRPSPNRQVQSRSPPSRKPYNSASSSDKCYICDGTHLTIYCNSFDVKKRREIADQKKLCSRCLNPGHHHLDCRSKYICPCKQPHSRVLCGQFFNRVDNNRSNSSSTEQVANESQTVSTSPSSSQTIPKTIDTRKSSSTFGSMIVPEKPTTTNVVPSNKLPLKYEFPNQLVSYYKTVVVRVNNENVRVLIDGGCGRSSILESCAKRLKLPEYAQHDLKISGMGGNNKVVSKRLVMANLNSIVTSHQLGVVLSSIPSFGKFSPASIPSELWQKLDNSGYKVSDTPNYHELPIEIILGLEYVGYIWLSMEREITADICIRESIFGWTAFGVTYKDQKDKNSYDPIQIMCCSFNSTRDESALTTGFLPEEQQFLDNFVDDKVKIVNDKFQVELPWLEPINLGTNERQALDRFHHLVKRLRATGRFERYSTAINETIANFAEPIPSEPVSKRVNYLPHHCVVRLDKSTSPERIVFDGSASESGYQSLNQCLFKGVTSWNSLTLLTNFRFGKYAIIADIEKAFLQIKVDPKDRDALRFWWFDNNGQPAAYRFNSVPFGTSTSPFLLYASMYKLFKRIVENKENPILAAIANVIKDRFYVDDLIAAMQSATPEQLNRIREATISMFESVGMNVRKWRTNHRETDQAWAPDASSKVKFLGTWWDIIADTLSLHVDISPHVQHSVITKRLFSSLLARIYDPLGLVSPYVVQLRLLLRDLWTQGLNWDEPVPPDLRDKALNAVKDVHLVNKVVVKRNVLPTDVKEATLVVFCDASKQALGTVAYSIVGDQVHLLFSKSKLVRLSPTKLAKLAKDDTIAELELDALVMGCELAHFINNLSVLSFEPGSYNARSSPPFSKIIICGDSLLNLQRLVKHPNDQRTSIFLRINRLAKLVPSATFRHVESKENPADMISRGCTMTDLLNNPKWVSPSIPSPTITRFNDQIRTFIASIVPVDPTCKCSRFSSYERAISTWRFIIRGLRHTLSQERQVIPDVALGKILLIKYVQRQHFGEELDAISAKKPVDRDSVLKSYKCFIDEDGILRLRTRLHSGENLTFDQVKPIMLPDKCHIVELIVQHEHRRLLHPGSDRTIYGVRDQFFVLGIRKYVRTLISQCRMCKLLRGMTNTVDLGMVPKFRYDFASTPFANVGIDIFGPLKVAMTTPGKRYGVIFSCATTRAVHIELIHNQTAESVFQAMLNFMARRGVPHRIYTDNGTNLMAIKKQFVRFLNQICELHPELGLNVEWIQLTVSSPWRGGFYERLIRTIKDTLIAITFGKTVDNNALATALYQIEARINSRPLFVFEGKVITPSHFFAKRPLVQIPQIGSKCYSQISRPSLIQYYKAMQSHVNAVWNAWHSQYLLSLKTFHQNLFLPKQSDSLRVGDAVILKNSTPSNRWPFGVVENVVKSDDGLIRTVYVRTHDKGNLVVKARDVRTLIPFECTKEIHEEQDAESAEPDDPNTIIPDAALTGSQGE